MSAGWGVCGCELCQRRRGGAEATPAPTHRRRTAGNYARAAAYVLVVVAALALIAFSAGYGVAYYLSGGTP